MLNIFSLGYVVWDKTNEDLQGGLTSAYTQYDQALETWQNYHMGRTVESFGIPLQDYLYDAQTNFEVYANRNNIPINAVNFWIFATGQHITEALERIKVDTSKLPNWEKYLNVIKGHIEGALQTHDTKTKMDLFSVLDSTVDKTKKDIKAKAEILDPRESILPFVLGGIAFLWLIR